MSKITLDRETFKALASDTRLDILKALDGKKMSLNDICTVTNLNKATLHEHLAKLHEAGLIKKNEREGHKWVYYQLTWKGESLLHPENTRIVVLFSTTFVLLWVGIIQLYWYVKGTVLNIGYTMYAYAENMLLVNKSYFDTKNLPFLKTDNGRNIPFFIPEPLRDFLTSKKFDPDVSAIPADNNIAVVPSGSDVLGAQNAEFVVDPSKGVLQAVQHDPFFLYVSIIFFCAFMIVLCISLWRFSENRTQSL